VHQWHSSTFTALTEFPTIFKAPQAQTLTQRPHRWHFSTFIIGISFITLSSLIF
jgi:hypothetical protein